MAPSNDLICEAGRVYRQNRRSRDSVHGKLRASLKHYGEQGVNLKSLVRIAGLIGKMEPMEVLKQIADDLHYARLLMRIELAPDDLFDGEGLNRDTTVNNSTRHEDDIMTAESRGFADGREGKTRDDCPYSDPEMVAAWRKWWKNGVDQRTTEKPGTRMASVPKGRRGRQSRMEGTERTQDSPRRKQRRTSTRKKRSDAGKKRGTRKMKNSPQVVEFPSAAQ